MPLNKSGSKKAFSENVRTEMHHGKPQKQALAIAYSTMRRAGHKMAKGGECMACGGPCQYAEGGQIGQNMEKVASNPAPRAGDQPDAAKKFSSAFHAKGGEVKGVHKSAFNYPIDKADEGMSEAGHQARRMEDAQYQDEEKSSGEYHKQQALSKHREVIGELKSMPKPKLKGLAHGGPVNLHDQEAKHFMDKGEQDVGSSEYALPHGLAEGGEVGEDHELMEHCASELMNAIEAKDKQGILDSIKAIVMSLKG